MADGKDEVLTRANARVGTMLRDKYRIDRVLGIGGMAVVYAATHRNKAELAIKMLHPELSTRADIRERFLREGYISNSVKHPGVVTVVDDDVAEDGAAFIVMEMLRGATVETLCEEASGRLPLAAAIAIGYQLLDVLASAHANAVVHRDIKPANVFVTFEGSLKVLDFGIARLRDAASGNATNTGTVLGTPAFMAPEQASGQTSHVGPQTDIWAVGATMFSMLTGELVHTGENSHQILLQAATAPPRPVMSVSSQVPPDIARVVDCSLAFRKEDRWPTAESMRDALRAAYTSTYGAFNEREPLIELLRPAKVRCMPTGISTPVTPPPARERDSTVAAAKRPLGAQSPGPLVPGGTPQPRVTEMDSFPATPQRLGGTTARPVERVRDSASDLTIPKRSLVPFAVLGAVGALVVAGGVAMAVRSTATVAVPAVVPIDAQVVVAVPVPVVVAPSAQALPEVVAIPPVPVVAVSATPPPVIEPAQTVRHSRGQASAKPTAASTPAGPAPTAAPAPSTKPGCDTPYYYDKNGQQRFKPECFE